MARWLLPEGVSDVLPHEARRLEELRRRLLDLYHVHGYALVMPPLLEYLDSLLTGVGADLDLRTFKLVDQLSGRMLGLRADTTPQVARIDAHILNRTCVTRLCYAGTVLHARAAHPLAVREPLQVGAEIYGHAGIDADLEVQSLAAASLRAASIGPLQFDLGHVGVVRAMLNGVPAAQADTVMAALAIKDAAALDEAVHPLTAAVAARIRALAKLHGGPEVLAEAAVLLRGNDAGSQAIAELRTLADRCEGDRVSLDLADLHGYRYYTGANFAVFVAGQASALLRGGRYDDIGRAFGRPRPASGFSTDLRTLAAVAPGADVAEEVILADATALRAGAATVAAWRAAGRVVVADLGNGSTPVHTHRMTRGPHGWLAVPVTSH